MTGARVNLFYICVKDRKTEKVKFSKPRFLLNLSYAITKYFDIPAKFNFFGQNNTWQLLKIAWQILSYQMVQCCIISHKFYAECHTWYLKGLTKLKSEAGLVVQIGLCIAA